MYKYINRKKESKEEINNPLAEIDIKSNFFFFGCCKIEVLQKQEITKVQDFLKQVTYLIDITTI